MMARGGKKKPFKIDILAHVGLFGYTYEVKVYVLSIEGVYRHYGSVLCNSQEEAVRVAKGYSERFKQRGY